MHKVDTKTVEKLQLLMNKDPHSQAFAPLADAYVEMGMVIEAEKLAQSGIKRHPDFVSGLVVYAKILKILNRPAEAIQLLKKATLIAPTNLMAHQLLGELFVITKNGKEALKAYKMVLFLNPHSEKASKIVQKLESISAEEYPEEVFAMTKLTSLKKAKLEVADKIDSQLPTDKNESPNIPKGLQRVLSLIDAFIFRNDLPKAMTLTEESIREFGQQSELDQRLRLIQSRLSPEVASSGEDEAAVPLRPILSRDQKLVEKQLEMLQITLSAIGEYRDSSR